MPIKWFRGRPPALQVRILKHLAKNGYASKPSMIEAEISKNYADIHYGINALLKYDPSPIEEYSPKKKNKDKPSCSQCHSSRH